METKVLADLEQDVTSAFAGHEDVLEQDDDEDALFSAAAATLPKMAAGQPQGTTAREADLEQDVTSAFAGHEDVLEQDDDENALECGQMTATALMRLAAAAAGT